MRSFVRATFVYVAVTTAMVSAQADIRQLTQTFEAWELKYDRKYTSAEHRDRAFMTFAKNLATITNIKNENPNSTWKAATNAFADLSQEEFTRRRLMDPRRISAERPAAKIMYSEAKSRSNPGSFDWREHGAVTPVHDQGSVGTCWAFSAIGNVEGQWFLNTNKLVDLSEEFLVDCDGTHDDTHADCSVFGGWPYLAYQYMIESGGVPSEEVWPYCSGTGDCYPCMQGPISLCGPPPYYCDKEIEEKCPIAAKTAKISDWIGISDEEEVIMDALVNVGPLSALLDATQLQFYDSGVWTGRVEGSPEVAGCRQDTYDHAVLLVGYGTDDGQSYWTVKNSWGEDWGEDGYFRIARGLSTCGINGEVTSALV